MWVIGVILAILSLAVLFDKLPGNLIAWIIVLICSLLIIGAGAITIGPFWRRPPA